MREKIKNTKSTEFSLEKLKEGNHSGDTCMDWRTVSVMYIRHESVG